MDPEGSVEVDNGSITSPVQDDPIQDQDESLDSESEEQSNNQPEAKEETPEPEEGVKLTPKGTKVDPNPQSAIHQELANEKRLRSDYEKVLTNPELLKKFAQEAGYSLSEAKEALEEEVYTAEKLQTGEDVAKALNEVRRDTQSLREENKRLKSELEGISSTRRAELVATTITSDISAVREKYPQLNPKNPDYDPDLEREIGELYNELDLDPKTGTYRGGYSLSKLTDRIMRASGKAEKKASEKAQIDVKVKQTSRVVTSAKPTADNGETSKDAATVIAQRIARSFKN